MNTLKKYKGIMVAIVIFLLAMGIYKMFTANTEITEGNLVAQSIGADIIELNSRIERVNLDPALFSSALYKSLVDFSAAIPIQPIGRINPFDLVGR